MVKWLSLKELSKYLKISKETAYRLTKDKNFPKYRIGKLWIFDQDEVDAYIKTKVN